MKKQIFEKKSFLKVLTNSIVFEFLLFLDSKKEQKITKFVIKIKSNQNEKNIAGPSEIQRRPRSPSSPVISPKSELVEQTRGVCPLKNVHQIYYRGLF